ncbi:hypothetical protein BaRGS_00001913 [Batillaria attramentaria]|uniref:Flavin-containing monooxygenase n=1 Tax=Batillaria attramentaria TaxID=370345 RepID=A0ABD0M5Z5_9CAEN
MSKRVAVIGGGCSGLAAIKCCVDEGLEPVCFERTDEVGGLWRYTDHVRNGQACVMRSTVINTSKEMMCFSDYPIPKEYPNYMHNTHVWQYFKDYAEHFKLYDHIQYNTEVVKVQRAADFAKTGRWDLHIRDHKSGEERTETFDAVLVCTGHHAEKNEPTFPGLSDFKGRVVHSHDYREPSDYVGKRILVIGIGNSGVDLAVELSRCGQVFLSTRRGAWVFKRLGSGAGLPGDIMYNTRLRLAVTSLLPTSFVLNSIKKEINNQFDHDLYSLTPSYPPLTQHPTMNDDLGNRIACGSVKVKTDVKKFTPTGVEFVDGTVEENIDEVLLATGYIFGFPFIEKEVVDVKNNRLPFYKYMFPPDLEHKTLAVIGCIQPLGAIMPIAELQCRLATRVFKGEVKLPSASEMWEDIRAKENAMAQRYWKSSRHTIQVDWVPFMDELAKLNGCKPDIVSLIKTDPVLAWHVITGPCTPYQYRLMGPGKWAGARDAILTTMDRVRFPLATRPLPKKSAETRQFLFWFLLVVVAVMIIRFFLA